MELKTSNWYITDYHHVPECEKMHLVCLLEAAGIKTMDEWDGIEVDFDETMAYSYDYKDESDGIFDVNYHNTVFRMKMDDWDRSTHIPLTFAQVKHALVEMIKKEV